MRLFLSSFEPIQIPYEQTSLPGYFFKVNNNDNFTNKNENQKQRPILVVHGGFDSTLEELYFSAAAAPALERGYTCLAFEGPGQGEVILSQKIPFRFDWEKVVTPVMDFLLNNKKSMM